MKLFLVAVICLEVASALLPAQRQDFSAMDDEALMRQLDELAPLPDKAHKRNGAFTPYPPTTASPTTHNPDLPFQANNPQGCGWRGFGVGYRTVGGVATIFAEFKWTVAIINTFNNSYTGVGSLIHPQVVLTVAHHFEAGGSWRVRAGEWSLKHNYEFYEHQARDVAEVVMHPKYDTNTLKYDMALLILSQPLTPGEHVGYLCLPPAQAATPPGSRCIVTGWGYEKFQGGSVQDIMKMIEMPVMEDRVCEQRLRPRVGLGFDLHSTMLCAGGERNLDACTKDGGAPLACPYATAPNRFYQAGIVSWGSGCGAEGVPGVYTSVAVLRPWVDELMLARGYGTGTYTFQ